MSQHPPSDPDPTDLDDSDPAQRQKTYYEVVRNATMPYTLYASVIMLCLVFIETSRMGLISPWTREMSEVGFVGFALTWFYSIALLVYVSDKHAVLGVRPALSSKVDRWLLMLYLPKVACGCTFLVLVAACVLCTYNWIEADYMVEPDPPKVLHASGLDKPFVNLNLGILGFGIVVMAFIRWNVRKLGRAGQIITMAEYSEVPQTTSLPV